jgi:rsbT co-antagonist protein RsbR
MLRVFQRLLLVNHPDEDTRRRGRNVITITLSMVSLALLSLPGAIGRPEQMASLISTLVAGMICLAAAALARSGQVNLAATAVIASCMIGIAAVPIVTGQVIDTHFFMMITLLISGVTLRPSAVWLVLVVVLVLLATVFFPIAARGEPYDLQRGVTNAGLLSLMAGLISALSASTNQRTLDSLQSARRSAEVALADLDKAKSRLEGQVAARTAELRRALAEVEARATQQQTLLSELTSQRAIVRALSVPVLPISRQTLVLPLVGDLDEGRIAQVLERALEAIQRTTARRLILDITGTPIVDSQVAQGLLRVVQAARLLGAETVLVGVRPEVAQSIIGLGLELQGLRTYHDLESAIAR